MLTPTLPAAPLTLITTMVRVRHGRSFSLVCSFFPTCSCSDFLGHDHLPSNGLAITPEHLNDDDDRSSHASSSDWTPQPQIGKAESEYHQAGTFPAQPLFSSPGESVCVCMISVRLHTMLGILFM